MIRDGDITISVLIRASHLTKIHQLLLLLADDLHLTTTTAHQWLRSSNVATCEVSGTHTSLCGTVAGLRHSHKSVWCCCWTASLTQVTHASPCGAVAGLRHSHKSVWRCCWTASLTQVTHASPCGAVAGLRHSRKSLTQVRVALLLDCVTHASPCGAVAGLRLWYNRPLHTRDSELVLLETGILEFCWLL